MCGIAGLFGQGWDHEQLDAMLDRQRHRGPDAQGMFIDVSGSASLGHNRLSIIDLSPAAHQPMFSRDGRLCIVFNGEIYNYLELRSELSEYPFRSRSDTEVILAAYERWGAACLERFIGMFAFLIWDCTKQEMFGARDRFGVKPLYYRELEGGQLAIASEIRTLAACGISLVPDTSTWATYLTVGLVDHTERTFWESIRSLPAGHTITWQAGKLAIKQWYNLAERVGRELDPRPMAEVAEEYCQLMMDSVRLRFRSDVPVGINLSGGLDSAALLALVQLTQGAGSDVSAFTFVTGDASYDELPWVETMLERTRHFLVTCRLTPKDVPGLAASVHDHQFEPFGGLPTLAYARLFEEARGRGVTVLLDGQGMDEQWAGYSYYRGARDAGDAPLVQGMTSSPVQPDCIQPEFRALAQPLVTARAFPDALRNLQLRDACSTKIPRALRYNDRASMRASTELREPFLDHRLVELAMRQRSERKIQGDIGKWLLRRMVADLLPTGVVEAPKRPLQTPQREWLRGPLRGWATEMIERGLQADGGQWLNAAKVRETWGQFCAGQFDNSFFAWQWISLGMMVDLPAEISLEHGARPRHAYRLVTHADARAVVP